ncbi:retrotransposon Gag-like protein 3 isoform X2 [Mesoplodon densirostris]|uniref:retrotransposon Gag-like protein 3 isoform X2 n=1 Tax=Mesoplodon densirostris TaxID=48708 RepID=UPI0028DB7F6E|nr:retrotransposon Gag-like protein 3 isoform X2 [Mesoplodon densirostris]
MVEDLAASYIALKLENEILQAQVQRLMDENAALQSQIPELQKSQAAKEDEPLQKPSEAQETQRPPETLDFPAAMEPQEPPEVKEPQKPRESQDLPSWEPSAAQEPQKSLEPPADPESLEPPGTQDPQAPPMVHKLAGAWESHKPSEVQDAPAGQETQNSELQDPPNAQELQEAPKCQDTSTHLESLEFLAPQELRDPSDAQEFLGLLTPKESLDSLTAAETSAASEFPQSSNRLEAETFPLEYPLVFNGDAQKLPEFLVQLNSYMRVRGHLYPTEAALVSFVGNRFSGEAGKWFQPLVDIQSPLLEQFESFIQVLQDTFDNPENMEDANHRIRKLCQGEDHVHQYATHFHIIAQELNWDESTLCIQFQEGLASSIRDELSRTNPATNLSDLITQCITLEEKLSGKPDLSPQEASPSQEKAGSDSPPAENQPVQASSNRPHLSEAERVRRREGHLCLYCGYPGHFARDCPVKPHRAQQAGNIEARR